MTTSILTLSRRPTNLSALVGQKKLVDAIRKQIATRTPSAFMFSGNSGVGKTTIARILAVAFQCDHQKLWGDPCSKCWEGQSEFAISEVNASELNGVEDMARVAEMSKFRPLPPSKRRVIILDEAQMLTGNAQNLLLKYFEESTKHTVWIICTTVPNKILVTLRRRCMAYQIKGLSYEDQEAFLKVEAKAAGVTQPIGPLVEHAKEAQISAPALLLMALEKYASGLSASESVTGGEQSQAESLAICKAVTSGNWVKLKQTMTSVTAEDVRWIRASVSGWLCGCLRREGSPKQREKLALSMLELIDTSAPFDGVLLMHWLWARLHKICGRFSGV